jgi:uncharacterized protein YegL
MQPYFATVQEHLVRIMGSIKRLVKEKYETLNLMMRFAVVAYRDYGDTFNVSSTHGATTLSAAPHICIKSFPAEDAPFTDNEQSDEKWQSTHITGVANFLRALSAIGGDDIPEDVIGALHATAEHLNWSKRSNARFAVLLCDAPGHGRDLCPADITDAPKTTGRTFNPQPTPQQVMDAFTRPDRDIQLLFCELNRNHTHVMEASLRQFYQKDGHHELVTVPLFKTNQSETTVDRAAANKGYHYVFALDESGSMGGSRWQQLMISYNTFLQQRAASQGQKDIVSVISYESSARVKFSCQTIETCMQNSGYRNWSMSGGGTDFRQAIRCSIPEMQKSERLGYVPVYIFMSDGQASDPEAEVREMRRCLQHRGFIMHVIGFDYDSSVLRNMARVAGFPNNYRHARNGMELQSTFATIAADRDALDKTLVQAFAKKVAEAVADRLMLDHL